MNWMFLPLKRYAEFSGRSRRMEYWLFVLFQVIVVAVFGTIFGAAIFSAFAARGPGDIGALLASVGIAFLLFGLFWLAMLLPSIAVAVRRLHDTDRSGWWLMLYLGPYLLSLAIQIVTLGARSQGLLIVSGVLGLVMLVGFVVVIVFLCLPGTVGANRFGPDPLFRDRDFAETFC